MAIGFSEKLKLVWVIGLMGVQERIEIEVVYVNYAMKSTKD